MDYTDGPNIIIGVLKKFKKAEKLSWLWSEGDVTAKERSETYSIAVLKIEEGAVSQGMWVASRI